MRIAYVETIKTIAESMTKVTKDNPDLLPDEKKLVIATIDLLFGMIAGTSVDAQELANQIAARVTK
jgi:hypothetical protein